MFAKLSTLALLLPLASATIQINSISGWATGGTVTVSWTATTQDPGTFSIELVNTIFHNTYAVGNNIVTANGQDTFELPQVPVEDGYTLIFIAPNNINDVYATSNSFAIASSSSSSGTASSSSATPLTTDSSATTSATLSTPSAVTTLASSVPSVVSTGASTGTSSAPASTPSTFSSSGAGSKLAGVAPVAALVLSAVAGAAMVF